MKFVPKKDVAMKLFKPFTADQAAEHLKKYFQKVQARKPLKPLQVRVYSQKLGLDFEFPSGSLCPPFHVASIGKVFTAVLIQMLAERGKLSIRDGLQSYFSSEELKDLFVYQNVDYASQVTIEHLLGHTSGIADYFEGIAHTGNRKGTKSFIDEVLTHPDHHWTPQELIEYTRSYQSAVGIPGQVFNYSDTGYILLGLIVERVTGKSFADNLSSEIFLPLGMCDSYLMFYTEPAHTPGREIEKIWLNGREVSRFESLSCDWAGGGIVSTTADLLAFELALRNGQLISKEKLEIMDQCIHRFQPGIYYGLGMMEIRFREFFFLLRHLPRVKGHIGVISTHMFYDPAADAHIVMNFGDNTRMVESFKALIEIENTIHKV
jgi:D-alanyl-D-alanine carboxypeptidase